MNFIRKKKKQGVKKYVSLSFLNLVQEIWANDCLADLHILDRAPE